MPGMDAFIAHLARLAVLALPVLLAITVHEAAHGWVAQRLGDETAARLGRVSFNPLRHIDLFGTILVPLAIFLASSLMNSAPLLFGWAKPVPVDWRKLRRPRRDMGLVAIAGPGANLLMALAWSGVLLGVAALPLPAWFALPLFAMSAFGMLINLFLMALNLFPLPPLDGGRILTALLPHALARPFARLEPFGLPILLLLLVSGWLGRLLLPVVQGALALLPGSELVFRTLLSVQ